MHVYVCVCVCVCVCVRKNGEPVHGTRAGHNGKVEEGEDENCAKAFFALDDVLPSQVLPVLFYRFKRYDLNPWLLQKNRCYLCCQWFYRR
jgi:hypothetical protein